MARGRAERLASGGLEMIPKVLGYTALFLLALFFVRLYQNRMLFRRVQKEYGIPMMPHSFLFGHLWTVAKVLMKAKYPPDCNPAWSAVALRKEFPELVSAGVLYMDVWPISYPMVTVYDPDIMAQCIQNVSLPRWWAQGAVNFKPFSGGRDLLHLEGEEWKKARAMFNPGFSARNILSLIPQALEEALVFRNRLRKVADTDQIVELERYTTDLTVDIIGRVVLGTRLDTQTRENKLMSAFLKQLGLIYFTLDLRKALDPTRLIRHWIYNRTIRKELFPFIHDAARNYEKIEGPKTVLSLALKSYIKDTPDYLTRNVIPPEFLEDVVRHIKIFLLGGHDTTATTIAFAYYYLTQHPDTLARTRAEHDEVLGADPAAAAGLISADPVLLNKLPYTAAVIKETLRLSPPISGTSRQAPKGFMLTNPQTGVRYPVHGFMITESIRSIHRDPRYWREPDRFMPERWLVRDPSDPYFAGRPGAWRPFELGVRNCIGQELAHLESRLALALTVREFDFQDMYPDDAPTMFGFKGYQAQVPGGFTTGHVKQRLPVKVRTRRAG